MMVPYAVATAYQTALARLSTAAEAAVAANLQQSAPALISAADMEVLRLVDGETAQAAASLAADLCTETLALNGINSAATIPDSALAFAGVDSSQILAPGTTRAQIIRALAEITGRAPQRAARETVLSTVAKNPDLRFARILSGPGACEWCTMLASRGAVYKSAETAAAGAHHNCRCTILPGLAGEDVSDGRYYKLWRASQNTATKEFTDADGTPLTGRALRAARTKERASAWTKLGL